jgi:Holliday junction resolvase-like predicted endonuclease
MAAIKPRRFYENDTTRARLKGVTTIMGAHLGWKTNALIGWAHKLGKEGRSLGERDDAAALGSCTHAIVEAALTGAAFDHGEFPAELVAKAGPNAERVVAAIKEKGWEVIACEVAISAESFGGTIDLVVRDGDRILLADLKTGRVVVPEHAVQMGGYAWLWRIHAAHHSLPIATEAVIIHAPPGEPLRFIPVSPASLVAGEQIFRHLLSIEECAGQIVGME